MQTQFEVRSPEAAVAAVARGWRRRLGAALLAWLACGPGAPAAALPRQDGAHWLTAHLDAAALGSGSLAGGRIWSVEGALAAGASRTHRIPLPHGGPWTLLAVCDDRCDDVDLEVRTPDGSRLGLDTSADALPLVQFVHEREGVDVVVRMRGCLTSACRYAVGLYAPAASRPRVVPAPGASTRPASAHRRARGHLGEERYFEIVERELPLGARLDATLRAQTFEPYLVAIAPDGAWHVAHAASSQGAQLQIDVLHGGLWRLVIASRRADASGPWTLDFDPPPEGHPRPPGRRAWRPVRGVAVGISDYPPGVPDLPYTAADAVRIRQALGGGAGPQADGLRVLVDGEATRRKVLRALREEGRRATPEETLVFFFSGHGVQLPADADDPADPDGLDEAIQLHDGPLRDDELAHALAETRAGAVLVILDACYSGGFAKDVIVRPGRMGVFSSEEHVTSAVAASYRAGGYLAEFVYDAVGKAAADTDGDGAVTADELIAYLHARYRAEPHLTAQHLVVDRGGVAGTRVLFR
ncbi:MAG: caspase family protein [Gemmatimonadetes bacterium]|nr:caspase family protein [Gemmatimonadota bacterium]